MTRETKLGLLVGMAMIIFICILVSDYLAKTQATVPPDLSQMQAQRNTQLPAPDGSIARRDEPLPDPQTERAVVRTENDRRSEDLVRLTRVEQLPEPDVLVQDTTADPPAPDRDTRDTTQRTQPYLAIHHVQPGERLWDIAVKHYGDGNYYRAIYEANKNKMSSPNTVRAGVRLVIPHLNPDHAAPAPAPRHEVVTAAPTPPAPTPRIVDYKIQPGDNLSTIAQKFYGSARDLDKLLALNAHRIDDPDEVAVGQIIRVPAPRR